MQIATGSYTGNGVNARAITGLGFEPDLVIVKRGDGSYHPVWRSSAMVGDVSAYLGASLVNTSNCIESLDVDGFTLGDDEKVNTDTKTYHWIAAAVNEVDDFAVGTYVGNSSDDRSISGLGFEPDLVVVKGNRADQGCWRSSAMVGDSSAFFGATTNYANLIQALEADGFQVGTSVNVNYTGIDYYWFAVKAVPGLVAAGTYTGDGSDNRSISGIGFEPEHVWVKRSGASAGRLRPSTLAGDSTLSLVTGVPATNRIQALEADGFQVGTDAEVNGNTYTYWYAAWRSGSTETVIPKTGSDSMTLSEAGGQVLEAKVGSDALALDEDRLPLEVAHDRAEALALGEFAGEQVAGADALALSDSGAAAQTISVSDGLGFAESAETALQQIGDRVELQATVVPALSDRVQLLAAVFCDRVGDQVMLQAQVLPLTTDAVLLTAMIINQDLEAAAAEQVIAPAAEVTFL